MSRRRALALLALLGAVGVVVGVVATSETPSKPRNADTATRSGATTVERRDLVETDTESGTLSYANSRTVYDRLSGTITWLPAVGQLIKPGQALLDVDGRPVILMDGRTPAYRDLSASDSDGQDILQLNRNLADLGFNPDGIVVDDAWQAATTAGVDLLQASLGQTETGALSLGQIVFLPGDQVISTIDATLGSTGGGSGASSPSSATTASTAVGSNAPEFVSLTTRSTSPGAPTATTSTTTTAKTRTPTTITTTTSPAAEHRPGSSARSPTLSQLTALLKAEAAQLKAATAALNAAKATSTTSPKASSPTKSSPSASKSPSSTGGGGSASAVLQTTSTRQIVTMNLDASKQSEATVGEKVSVEMPTGIAVNGKITEVSRIAQAPTSSSNSTSNTGATIPVTITLTGHHQRAGLDQATVSVNFAQAIAKHVLSVPVTALLATSGGSYAVEEAAAPHQLLPVTTGLFAAGDVQISGPGIYAGLQVTDSQG
jgi:hypothetical protein